VRRPALGRVENQVDAAADDRREQDEGQQCAQHVDVAVGFVESVGHFRTLSAKGLRRIRQMSESACTNARCRRPAFRSIIR
jgi:hypothetical protein